MATDNRQYQKTNQRSGAIGEFMVAAAAYKNSRMVVQTCGHNRMYLIKPLKNEFDPNYT